jgi:molybdenum cofactor guanylyltransferase
MDSRKDLCGVILIGGKSTRMGKPKHLINYKGQPQYVHVFNMLKLFCDEVYISGDEIQALDPGYQERVIMDAENYKDHGPISGLLSAFEKTDTAILLVACDYPFLTLKDLEYLISSRDKNAIATVFINPDDKLPEPLIAIYEKVSFGLLEEQFKNQKYSLRKFLNSNPVKTPQVLNKLTLKSVDTPNEYDEVIIQLKNNTE